MNSRQPRSRQDRDGYVSLLAMSFAFGLAVFGGALAVGLRAYITSSAAEQRDILDRITLESAANDVLGRLAAGESHSIKPSTLADIVSNQRTVLVGLSLPEGKYDLQGDPVSLWLDALQRHGLTGATSPSTRFYTLVELSQAWRLSAAEEDCLRGIVTVGRAPEEFRPEAAFGNGEGLTRSVAAGDQVDIRAALATPAGIKTLWVRARFTGAIDRPWRVHDSRRLKPGAEASCETAE